MANKYDNAENIGKLVSGGTLSELGKKVSASEKRVSEILKKLSDMESAIQAAKKQEEERAAALQAEKERIEKEKLAEKLKAEKEQAEKSAAQPSVPEKAPAPAAEEKPAPVKEAPAAHAPAAPAAENKAAPAQPAADKKPAPAKPAAASGNASAPRSELFYPIYHLVVHEHAPVEEIPAVRHTVSDRPDIVQGGYHARFGIGDGLEDKVYPFRMVGNVRRELQTRFARRLMGDDAAFDTDAFYEPLGKKRVLARGDHVDNLILYRRAAAVQYKNYHFSVKMCRLEYINYMSFTPAPLPHRESLPPSHRPRPAKSRHTITLPAA